MTWPLGGFAAERARFGLALACSVLLHASALWWTPARLPARSATGPLQVTLRSTPPVQAAVAVAVVAANVLTQRTLPAPAVHRQRQPEPAPPQAVPAPRRALPGEARVLVIIDERGRPGQLIWNYLPALTTEQFQRLERGVRQRTYASVPRGTALNEVIDVFALIGAPQPQATPAAPAADNPAEL